MTVLTKRTAAAVKTREVRYRHVDRLGSPDADTAEDLGATLVEAHGFDAWGKPRDGSWLSSGDRLHPSGEPGTVSTRGFTGHEHLDSAYLIHMNGRVYDYRLGRFLSVDPIISNPLSSQAINPYSYIGNNPLSGTDPTGYQVTKEEEGGSVDGGSPNYTPGAGPACFSRAATAVDAGDPGAQLYSEELPDSGGRMIAESSSTPMECVGAPAVVNSSGGKASPGGVAGGGVSIALALGVGVQADAQFVTDGQDAGLQISVGVRAGWNAAAGVGLTGVAAPEVPGLTEFLGADPGSPSASISVSAGVGLVVASASVSPVQYMPFCGNGPASAAVTVPAYSVSPPGGGFDVGPYISGGASVFLPIPRPTPKQAEALLQSWPPGY